MVVVVVEATDLVVAIEEVTAIDRAAVTSKLSHFLKRTKEGKSPVK